jgi:hypothetical protein
VGVGEGEEDEGAGKIWTRVIDRTRNLNSEICQKFIKIPVSK